MSRRLIVRGGSRPRELILVDRLIVGRDPSCDIAETSDPLLSRRHAAFEVDQADVVVRDLGSRNGILVNGAKAKTARLSDGDVVQVGHLQVKYVDELGPFTDVSIGESAAPPVGEHDPTAVLSSPEVSDTSAPTKPPL